MVYHWSAYADTGTQFSELPECYLCRNYRFTYRGVPGRNIFDPGRGGKSLANSDSGKYAYDNFANEIFIPIAEFINTNESRDYYFGGVPDQVFSADIWGATIELSLLGVPQGVAVDHIRVRGVGVETSADFIGVGSFRGDGTTVPEPGVLTLLGIGLIGLIGVARRKKS